MILAFSSLEVFKIVCSILSWVVRKTLRTKRWDGVTNVLSRTRHPFETPIVPVCVGATADASRRRPFSAERSFFVAAAAFVEHETTINRHRTDSRGRYVR